MEFDELLLKGQVIFIWDGLLIVLHVTQGKQKLVGVVVLTVRRGDYRNFYKGHMDKIEGEDGGGEGGGGFGWGGVEGWGEKAYNCN